MDSEEEEEVSEEDTELKPKAAPVSRETVECVAPTKAQSRELRRLVKLDHGWFSHLLDS